MYVLSETLASRRQLGNSDPRGGTPTRTWLATARPLFPITHLWYLSSTMLGSSNFGLRLGSDE